MSYEAVKEARRAAEARSGDLKEGVRLGLEMKRELEIKLKKLRQGTEHAQN